MYLSTNNNDTYVPLEGSGDEGDVFLSYVSDNDKIDNACLDASNDHGDLLLYVTEIDEDDALVSSKIDKDNLFVYMLQ